MLRLEVEAVWLFRRAYHYAQIYEESWWISWKVKRFLDFDEVPPEVERLCDVMIEDNRCLFFRREAD